MSDKKTTAPADAAPKRRQLVDDPELAAMNRIARLLEPLAPAQRERVLRWVIDRYTPPAPVAVPAGGPA